jgi:cell division protein FtsN
LKEVDYSRGRKVIEIEPSLEAKCEGIFMNLPNNDPEMVKVLKNEFELEPKPIRTIAYTPNTPQYQEFIKKYPDHLFANDAQRALEQMRSGTDSLVVSPEPIEEVFQLPNALNQPEDLPFTVQVGAFSDRRNAVRLQEKFSSLQYEVKIVPRIISGKRLFLVHVGAFASDRQAKQYGDFLQERFGVSFRVVKRND